MRFVVVTDAPGGPRERVLIDSLGAMHPDAQVMSLVATERVAGRPRPGDLIPHGLDIGGFRWVDLVLGFGGSRAGWAVLPWILELADSAGRSTSGPTVVVNDTFVLFEPVGSLAMLGDMLAARARFVDGQVGPWGGYLPGFLVAPPVASWGEWWRRRAIEQITSAGSTPEVDLWWELPVGSRALEDPTLRLSATTAGDIELDAAGRLAGDGRSPALVDFAGLDPDRPWWFAPPGVEPAAMQSRSPGLRLLCGEQVRRLEDAGWGADGRQPAELLPGVAATPELRSWYRGLLGSRTDGTQLPNPLVSGGARPFLDLLASNGDPAGTGVNKHVDQLCERRSDLSSVFPHARWRDRRAWHRWLWSHGLSEGEISLLTLPDPPRAAVAAEVTDSPRPFGVNLVGYLGAELGLGVAARRLRRALDAAGVPNKTVSYDRTSSNLRADATGDTERPYHFNLLLITPDQLPLFVEDVGAEFLAGHHNIGLWYWESDVIAPQQERAFDLVDEVWVATHYLTRAFAGAGRVPVRVVPSPLVFEAPPSEPGDRERLGLDDRFTFLFSFDYLSVSERKNPTGLVEAYRRAFPDPDGDTSLVLKSINGHLFPELMEKLAWEVADRPDIRLRDELLPAADRLTLVAVADCYVSLHRSEGLGLTMAEAMAVGTPVIATAYSGNLDFMPDRSTMLVPATEVEVGPGGYYPAHGHWADPDLAVAAESMRRVRDEPGLRDSLSVRGRKALEPFSYQQVGTAAREALLEAWRGPAD